VERSLDPFPGKREPTRVSKTRVRSHLVKISNSVSPKAGNPSGPFSRYQECRKVNALFFSWSSAAYSRSNQIFFEDEERNLG